MSGSDKTSAVPVIRMENVSIGSLHRPGTTVLEQVNWTVERGEFWVVAGHHGSGKSDLLMTLAGLIPPEQGRYHLLGERMPIFEDSRLKVRLKVGVTFNGGQLLNRLTLGENVRLPLRYHGDLDEVAARERTAELIETLELTPWVDQLPGRVGRQWQERAGLARALVMEPEVLLLDDPLSGLDARHTAWWVSFLGRLVRGGSVRQSRSLTLVLTTDTLSPWCNVATHCGVLENGAFEVAGCLEERQVRDQARVREFMGHGRWTFDDAG